MGAGRAGAHPVGHTLHSAVPLTHPSGWRVPHRCAVPRADRGVENLAYRWLTASARGNSDPCLHWPQSHVDAPE